MAAPPRSVVAQPRTQPQQGLPPGHGGTPGIGPQAPGAGVLAAGTGSPEGPMEEMKPRGGAACGSGEGCQEPASRTRETRRASRLLCSTSGGAAACPRPFLWFSPRLRTRWPTGPQQQAHLRVLTMHTLPSKCPLSLPAGWQLLAPAPGHRAGHREELLENLPEEAALWAGVPGFSHNRPGG